MTGENQDQQNEKRERMEMRQKLASLEDICQRTLEAVPYEDAPGGQGADAAMISGIVRATLKEEKIRTDEIRALKRLQ